MTQQDKYGISAQIDKVLESQAKNALLASRPDMVVSSIWEEVYTNMPLCDPEDSSPYKVTEILKSLCGDNLKVEESCGLFSLIRLTLPNSTCYLHRCQGSYYILPLYKTVRRFYTRLEPEVAADLILEFDRFAPKILNQIDKKKRGIKQKEMTRELLKTSVLGIINRLKNERMISVPDEVTVSGATTAKINICFKSHKPIHCRLEDLERILIQQYGVTH